MLFFFFWGGGIRLAKTAGGRYNIPIGKAPPKVGGFQGKEPTGGGFFRRRCRFGPFAVRNAVQFFRFRRFGVFGVCAAGVFFFCFEEISPRFLLFLFVGWIFLQAFPVDVVRSFFVGSSCWAEKRLLDQNLFVVLRSTFWMWWWMASFYLE